jgi:hypothetical protein
MRNLTVIANEIRGGGVRLLSDEDLTGLAICWLAVFDGERYDDEALLEPLLAEMSRRLMRRGAAG